MVSDDFENFANRKVIVELAEKNRLPAIYPSRLFVEAGGLMSYGADVPALGQRVAAIVGQILKGMKPSEIPIFEPTKFELVINLKTAKMLGLTVPPALLATADLRTGLSITSSAREPRRGDAERLLSLEIDHQLGSFATGTSRTCGYVGNRSGFEGTSDQICSPFDQ